MRLSLTACRTLLQLLAFACPLAPSPALASIAVARPVPTIGVHSERIVVPAAARSGASGERTLQISVWYAAARDTSAPVTYGDYFDLAASETAPAADSAIVAARESYAGFLTSHGLPRAAFDRWFASRCRAIRDAAPLGSRQPLVVIAQGNGQSAVDQCRLAERLASGGFVVLTCPSSTRLAGPPRDEADLGPGAERQADDIAALVAYAARRPDVDIRHIGLVGHSLGARGALFYAMRDPRVRALVSLDGGIGTATGLASMAASPSFASHHLRAHVLHFYEMQDAFMAPDFTLLGRLRHPDILLARTPTLHHHHFTSLGDWCGHIPELAPATLGNEFTAQVASSVQTVTLSFLRRHVLSGPDLEARAEGYRDHLDFDLRSLSAGDGGPTSFRFETLRAAVASGAKAGK